MQCVNFALQQYRKHYAVLIDTKDLNMRRNNKVILLLKINNNKAKHLPDKCFLDESSLSFLSVSDELVSMTTKTKNT